MERTTTTNMREAMPIRIQNGKKETGFDELSDPCMESSTWTVTCGKVYRPHTSSASLIETLATPPSGSLIRTLTFANY